MNTPDANTPLPAGFSQFPCNNCGGSLLFKPGTSHLKCPNCGTENSIETDDTDERYLTEHDFLKELEKQSKKQQEAPDATEAEAVRCTNCGASTTVTRDRTADRCPYCDSPLVIQNAFSHKFNVQAVLPFAVDTQTAQTSYRDWLKSRWFAPNDFTRRATREEALKGIYMPFWTYDADTHTRYRGKRGDAYYVTNTVTVQRNGRMVQEDRQERRIHWTNVSGQVFVPFDDVLVPASSSLPSDLQDRLAPWPLQNLKPFRQEFLSGFVTETYQIPIGEGFDDAKGRMEPVINRTIRADIGGDEQRILDADTRYSKITFKHILLPLWTSAYRYNNVTYRFMINAQTGEVTGNRPWSVWKIAAAVLAGMALAGGIFYMLEQMGAFS